jgi:hypothetical protein
LFKDRGDHGVEVVVGIGVIEPFGESVDKDAGIWRYDVDLGIGPVIVFDWQEDVSSRKIGVWQAPRLAARVAFSAQKVISNDRVDLDFAKETAASLHGAEEKNAERDANGGIDSVLDAGKDGDDDPGKEDDNLDGRDSPKLVDGIRRGD